MNKLRQSTLGLGLTFLVAACGSESSPPASTGGTPGVGGSGTAGQNGGGATSKASGGMPGTSSGGSSGGTSGGAAAGGATTTGGATAAVGGSTAPGTGGASDAGTAGTSTGGSTPVGGESGGGAGGTPSAGGAAGTPGGGAPPAIDELEVVTSAQNAYWQEGTLTEVTSGNADVTVNESSTAQTFTGFGGTFNERGWQALSWLSEADRAAAVKLLFDAADGAKFTYGRIPIGASDYAVGSLYTLNDSATADPMMEKFSIERDKQYLIPFIKAAIAVKPDIRFWASPWTPPPWMKSNNAHKEGSMKDDATVLDAFALYLAKFVEEYGKEGIPITAIHPQNEPGFVQDYPSCSWTGALMAKFIGNHLGPTFQERGVTAEIFVGTMSNTQNDAAVLNAVSGNATAMQFVKGFGLQWGMIDVWDSLNMPDGMAVWQTEHKCGNYPWLDGYNGSRAPNDHAYGVESWGLIRDWIRKGVTSYSAWNMVLDPLGKNSEAERDWKQNALMTVDEGSKKLTVTPAYYVFRHVSQYVDPGAKVVGTSGGDALAFKNPDGSVVAVLFNSGAAKMVTVAIGSKKYQFNMPGNGWATLNPQL
jgi:glucosylceramidase